VKGFFISFEGIEACGKSTQARNLTQYLRKLGYEVILIQEPGGTIVGEKIREIILSPENSISNISELFLYLASRAQVIEEVVKPALSKEVVVIADRFSDSTFAYQVFGRGLPWEIVFRLNEFATGGLEPDLTFLLEIPLEESLRRKEGKDRIEKEEVDFHRKVALGYEEIARKFPGRIKKVPFEEGEERVFKRILQILDEVGFWEK
jgi:dTMP kinase